MPRNYFITGMPKSGKTTLLRKIVEQLRKRGLRVGGFITPEERLHGTRTGFEVEDVESGRRAVLAAVGIDGPKVAKYHVDIAGFESVALPVLKKAGTYDVIAIDEIGRMELKSQRFSDALDSLLESGTPLIATVHRDYMEKYGVHGEVMMLTQATRESLYMELLRKTEGMGRAEAPRAPEKQQKQAQKGKESKEPAKAEPRKEEKKAAKDEKKKAKEKPEKKEKAKEREEKEGRDEEEEERDEADEDEEHPRHRGKRHGIVDTMRDLIGF